MTNNFTYPGGSNTNSPQSNILGMPQAQTPMPPTQQQQYFLQSQGNVFMINNPMEVSNVPVGVGLSAAISLAEGFLYLKTMQNGVPMVVGYKLSPLETIPTSASAKENVKTQIPNQDNSIMERLDKIEKFLTARTKEGDKLQWQI